MDFLRIAVTSAGIGGLAAYTEERRSHVRFYQ
jgi:hypothetical protein